MTFEAFDEGGGLAQRRHYFSVGGGTVLRQYELESRGGQPGGGPDASPFPFRSRREMLDMAEKSGLSIDEMQMANELQHLSEKEVNRRLDEIWQAMRSCIDRARAG